MAFRFDKLTQKAQEAVQRAQEIAADAGNPQIESLRLLASLVDEQEGIVRPLLDAVGVNQQQLRQMITAELSHLPKTSGGAPPQLGNELSRVLDGAQQAATEMKDDYVSTEHLLLSLARTKS